MSSPTGSPASEEIDVDLRNPGLAAFLAWLWPGAGHIYQRRYGKGFLFMACILGVWFFGLTLGSGKVAYASWKKNDYRWQYLFQVGVGAPALPALLQARRMEQGKEPLWGGWMAPPRNVAPDSASFSTLRSDELAQWHLRLNSRFELGTLYTMIAGLLNVLAIYDAYAGPMLVSSDQRSGKPPPDEKAKDKEKKG